MKPKTLKKYLNTLRDLAETRVCELKGGNLSEDDQYEIGSTIAGLQNDLGEDTMIKLYEKLKLKPYDGSF